MSAATPDPVEVPDAVGLGLSEAETILEIVETEDAAGEWSPPAL